MVKLDVLIRPFKLDEVAAVLAEFGIEKLKISEVSVQGGPEPRATWEHPC